MEFGCPSKLNHSKMIANNMANGLNVTHDITMLWTVLCALNPTRSTYGNHFWRVTVIEIHENWINWIVVQGTVSDTIDSLTCSVNHTGLWSIFRGCKGLCCWDPLPMHHLPVQNSADSHSWVNIYLIICNWIQHLSNTASFTIILLNTHHLVSRSSLV